MTGAAAQLGGPCSSRFGHNIGMDCENNCICFWQSQDALTLGSGETFNLSGGFAERLVPISVDIAQPVKAPNLTPRPHAVEQPLHATGEIIVIFVNRLVDRP